ncbi:demethoxyubiquinone hydroxylase family protein [Hyphococcus sp.]|uniref:demethoxyubiquinone hydroxylase family protein n=1 Tax=Hyphococcus sp. TaxID=2038636 RepID=UPI003CCB8499
MNEDGVKKPGPRAQRIAEMLRVDHAGEYGAVAIYRGQRAVFDALPHKARMSALLNHMEAGEAHHLATFNRILGDRNIRPSLLSPLWNAAGFGLGAATALMSDKAAMACTDAVEDVIEKHYAAQIVELDGVEPVLADTIREFRDDELEHKATAEQEGSKSTPGYRVLSSVIRLGCRTAIKIAEKL